jgi:arylsulfatase A-like enzyme
MELPRPALLVATIAATLACAPPAIRDLGALESIEAEPVAIGMETRPALPESASGRWRIDLTPVDGHLVLAGGCPAADRLPASWSASATFTPSSGEARELFREAVPASACDDPLTGWVQWNVPVPDGLAGVPGSLLLEIDHGGATPTAALPAVVPREPADRPNVILISVDTLRSDRIGCYGNPRETSPTIDRLARDGVRFRRVVAPSNWTLPSHYSMMTSLYPTAHGVNPDRALFGGLRRPTGSVGIRGSPGQQTLAERMESLGYLTAAVTENGWVHPAFGFDQGFASYVADTAGTMERTRARVLDWLSAQQDLPFFLFVHTYQPHQPYDQPPPYDAIFVEPGHVGYALPGVTVPVEVLEDFQKGFYLPTDADVEAFRALYDGEVRYVDDLVAELVASLEELGLVGRTVVIFTSDHGEEIFEHGRFSHGDALYDEVMRVPLIVWGPGRIEAGVEIEPAVSLVDILPTIVELAGGVVEGPVQGRSLLAGLTGNPDAIGSRELFGEGIGKDSGPFYCVWRGSDKYILTPGQTETNEELYDLSSDPGETANLAASDAATAAELRGVIEGWVEANRRIGEAFGGDSAAPEPEVLERLRALGYID